MLRSIWRRIARKEAEVEEVLEEIHNEIQNRDNLKLQQIERERRVIRRVVYPALVIYFSIAFAVYLLFLPKNVNTRVQLGVLAIIVPVMIYLLKRAIHWYYLRKINYNVARLHELKEQKSKIIEEIMEKKTYKKVKELLEKYNPEKLHDISLPSRVHEASLTTDVSENLNESVASSSDVSMVFHPSAEGTSLASKLPLPRNILPRNRSFTDRIVDLVVGDGPQNRYALICNVCKSHNGMAMQEEFEFISFRCCYCYHFNDAKKKKPQAPNISTSANSSTVEPIHIEKTVD